MVELHKSLMKGRSGVTVLDTPYGFQANADELSKKAVEYFARSVGVPAQVASLRSQQISAADLGRGMAALREADYVFSGPGSPTYALRQWTAMDMAAVFADVVERGGVVTLASAASVCAGHISLPVYEIYKAGIEPAWQPGLDLLGRFGVHATVVPHFNNTEGGTHDTSCCYVGRSRLEHLRTLEPDVAVIGLDEHTALVFDPSSGTASVHGLGRIHLLVGTAEYDFGSGESFDLRASLVSTAASAVEVVVTPAPREDELRTAFLEREPQRVAEAIANLLPREHAATVMALVPVLAAGWADVTGPYEQLLLTARQSAREAKAWALSDLLRDGLASLGCHVEDTPQGQRVSARAEPG